MASAQFRIALIVGRLRYAPAPSHGRSPFRSWLQVVFSFIFMFWLSYRGLAPHLHRAHADHVQPGTCDAEKAV